MKNSWRMMRVVTTNAPPALTRHQALRLGAAAAVAPPSSRAFTQAAPAGPLDAVTDYGWVRGFRVAPSLSAAGVGGMGGALREGLAISTRRDGYDGNGINGEVPGSTLVPSVGYGVPRGRTLRCAQS